VKQSLLAKRVFLVSKGRYLVSQQGRAYLRHTSINQPTGPRGTRKRKPLSKAEAEAVVFEHHARGHLEKPPIR
jgi:hypothetical protein